MLTVQAIDPDFSVFLETEAPKFPDAVERLVDDLWKMVQRCGERELTDGWIVSAVSVAPAEIRACRVKYRYFMAQRACPELFDVLNVRPIAVSGVLECSNGLVFGRRADSMTQEAGRWELVPSGGLDGARFRDGSKVDYLVQILSELQEEVGLTGEDITSVRPFCLIDDSESDVLDIGVALSTCLSGKAVRSAYAATMAGEYDELAIVARKDIERFLGNRRECLVHVSAELLRYLF